MWLGSLKITAQIQIQSLSTFCVSHTMIYISLRVFVFSIYYSTCCFFVAFRDIFISEGKSEDGGSIHFIMYLFWIFFLRELRPLENSSFILILMINKMTYSLLTLSKEPRKAWFWELCTHIDGKLTKGASMVYWIILPLCINDFQRVILSEEGERGLVWQSNRCGKNRICVTGHWNKFRSCTQ